MYKNISGTSKSRKAMEFACSDTVPCSNIVLNNVNLAGKDGEVEAYCNSAIGFGYGLVQPSIEACLTSSDKRAIIDQNKDAEVIHTSREHLIHTEL